MKYVLGIDEVGRANVIGPMVIAAIGVPEKILNTKLLNDLIIRDSKKTTKNQREFVYKKLKNKVYFDYEIINAEQISSWDNINTLEAKHVEKLIMRASKKIVVSKIIIDNFDPSREKFLSRVNLPDNERIVIEHYADENYVACSLASMFAKRLLDLEIERIKSEYGEIGSFNASDYRTVNFIANNIDDKLIRKNYITWRRLNGNPGLRSEIQRLTAKPTTATVLANVYKKWEG